MDNNDTYKRTILAILEVIDYQDDKEKFIKQFIHNTHAQTLIDLLKSLPTKKQVILKEQLKNHANDQEKQTEIIRSEFNEQQIQQAFENAVKNAITEWMEAINYSLSEEQKKKLIQLAEDLQGNKS
jgi:hypothetical protein